MSIKIKHLGMHVYIYMSIKIKRLIDRGKKVVNHAVGQLWLFCTYHIHIHMYIYTHAIHSHA